MSLRHQSIMMITGTIRIRSMGERAGGPPVGMDR